MSGDAGWKGLCDMLEVILGLINMRKNKILLLAESALPESQYKAFRKLFLNELGEKGLEADLLLVFDEEINSFGSDTNGREQMMRKRRCRND